MSKRTRIAVAIPLLVSAVCAAAAFADNQTVIYQDGLGGYDGQTDNHLSAQYPDYYRGNQGTDNVYGQSGLVREGLLRFGGIPVGATVVSATLTVQSPSGNFQSGAGGMFYRMLQPWSGTDTYNSWVSGIQTNGVEASSTVSFQTTTYAEPSSVSFDVTADVQAWAAGQANYGWVLVGKSAGYFSINTGEYHDYTLRPKLTIVYGTAHGQDTWSDGSGDHAWNTTSGNWLNGGVPQAYPEGDLVTFDDAAGAGHYNVAIPANVNPSRMYVNNSADNYAFTGAGAIGGGWGASLTKLGKGTMTLGNTARNTFSAGVTVYQGVLALDLSAISGHTNVIDPDSRLVLSGGALVVVGNPTGSSSQGFANVNFDSGASSIAINTNGGTGTTLNLGSVTRTPGSTVDFTPPTGGSKIVLATSTPYPAPAGFLLGYATFGGSDWAVGAADGTIMANPTYVADTWSTNNHTDVTSSVSVASGAQSKTLRFNSPTGITLTLAGTARLYNGGILMTANVGSHNNAITGGTLTSAITAAEVYRNYDDLAIIQNDSQGTLTIQSKIIYSSSIAEYTGLTISGCGVVAVTGSNTYAGITTVNKGATLAISQMGNGGISGPLGASSNAAANLVLNQGTLRYTGSTASTDRLFTLGPGGGCLDSSGSGTITFSNTGAVAYFQDTPAVFTLTGTNTGANILAPQILDPDTSHQYTTALVKSGSGKWILTNANAFTGGTTITGGILQIGNGGTTGAVGTGPIVNNGISLIIFRSNAISLNNSITGTGGLQQLGSGTTTLGGMANNYSGATTVQVGLLVFSGGGTHHIGGVSMLTGSLTIDGGTTIVSKGVTAISTGRWTIGGTHQLAAGISTTGTSIANVAPTFTGTGTLDLTDNKMIVKPTGAAGNKAALVSQLTALLRQGRHGGDWLGAGITSSTVAAAQSLPVTQRTSLNLYDNADLGLPSFGGQAVTASALLITTALTADGNFDGVVDSHDFDLWNANRGQAAFLAEYGDYNLDGLVDGRDFDLWYAAAGDTAQPLLDSRGLDRATLSSINVPEPATLMLAAAFFPLLLARRPRMRGARGPQAGARGCRSL